MLKEEKKAQREYLQGLEARGVEARRTRARAHGRMAARGPGGFELRARSGDAAAAFQPLAAASRPCFTARRERTGGL